MLIRKIVEEYLKIKPCHRLCFQDYNLQLTSGLRTTHLTHTTFSIQIDVLHHHFVLTPGRTLVPCSLSPYGQVETCHQPGGKVPLRFQMHEIISVNSGQYCHCWLSQGCLKGLFPIVFPRTCPKMFPSKPTSRKTPAEEQRTIAHKVPSSIAISRISAVKVN